MVNKKTNNKARERFFRDLAKTLKETRLSANMTQQELADKSGVDQGTISRIEKGQFNSRSNVTLERIIAIFEKGFGKDINIGLRK